jgi:hypothetical protein
MEVSGPPPFRIVPVGTNQFADRDGPARMHFERNAENRVIKLIVHQGKDTFVHWKTTPTNPPVASYEGKYFSEELDTRYTFAPRNGQLVVKHVRDGARLVALEAEPDRLVGSLWWAEQIRFRRDATGAITGFNLTVGRQKNLEFRKE